MEQWHSTLPRTVAVSATVFEKMIYNIRGTSGAGKTTLVRSITGLFRFHQDTFVSGRKRPIATVYWNKPEHRLCVVGSYRNVCGGCDTIKTIDEVFAVIRGAHSRGQDVIFEGLLVSVDFRRTVALYNDGLPLTVIGLKTPIDVCIRNVEKRRRKRGVTEPLNPKNTVSKHKGVSRSLERLGEIGIATHWLTYRGARNFLVRALL